MSKVFLVSLGCAKNLVDSEHMLGLVEKEGHRIIDDPSEADIAIVNTCAFIKSATEESIDTIFELARLKGNGTLRSLIVAGCFVQRYGKKLMREIPEVDGWLGTGEFWRIAEIISLPQGRSPILLIDKPRFLANHNIPRIQTTPFYSAYLKIAEGCSHHCSYCIIPSLRGPYRSRAIESLFIEAQNLVEGGVREINLVAQDTTWYGHDLDPPRHLEDLLERLLTISGLQWLRILYAHPYHLTERLLELMDSESVVCPYLDVPIQHVHPDILRAMCRPFTSEPLLQLVERMRTRKRNISLRTTMMVGFPGETEGQFRKLCDFIREARFDRLGVFSFSPEKGTPAAKLRGRIPEKVVENRVKELMKIQAEISKQLNTELVGKTVPVLVEGYSPETELLLTGRTATMAPDVDGQVLINEGTADTGEIVPVRITEAHAYDLVGRIERNTKEQSKEP